MPQHSLGESEELVLRKISTSTVFMSRLSEWKTRDLPNRGLKASQKLVREDGAPRATAFINGFLKFPLAHATS